MEHNVGDVIYFSSFGYVHEGTVMEVEGPGIRVKSKCPGTDWIMANRAFKTRKELLASESYSRDYFSAQRLASRRPLTGMAEIRF